jgi:hypothetical protein
MLIGIRKLFLLLSALGYGFLGGGPSLWAMDLRPGDPVMACLQMGCTCRMRPGHGAVCCCVANRALIRKFPALVTDAKFWKALHLAPPGAQGACGIHGNSCCPMDSGHGLAPVPQQLHLTVSPPVFSKPVEAVSNPGVAHAWASLDADAPDPRPD